MKKSLLVVTLIIVTFSSIAAKEKKDPTEQLRNELVDTVWQWDGDGGEKVHFIKDGFIEHPGWTNRGLVTSWTVIDQRTVLFKIENGRNTDRYAILTFNDSITAYDGYNFHHGENIKLSSRLNPPPAT